MRRHLLTAVVAAVLVVAAVAIFLVAGRVLIGGEGDDDGPGGPSAAPTSAEPTTVPGTALLPDAVETTGGPVRGITDGAVRSWLGLPYAAPPTGGLRWRPPAPVTRVADVREASAYGASCVQPEPYRFGQGAPAQRAGSSEDCLFLNVSRPDDQRRDLPVVVWLHGGGFFAGSGSTATGMAGSFVERGVVLVSVNYRLGRLGFFAHPSLRGRVGNFGLLDQVAALEWVRDNAAAFGGDADNVTLAGGSAGAMSVNALMSAPVADGLFDKAISQSAPGDERALTLEQARGRGAEAFPGLDPAALRALPAEDLLSSTFNTLSGDAPLVDAVLPAHSAQAFLDGTEAAVPYLVGTTVDEFDDDAFRAFQVDPVELRDGLGGAQHDALVAAYGDRYADEVLDDLVFDLPSLVRAVTHGGRAPTYRYVFASLQSSGHGAESDFVFDAVTGGADGRLSDAVADYWAAFARTGRPQVEGLPDWPRASGAALSSYLEIGPGTPRPHLEEERLARLSVLRRALSENS